MLASGGLAQDIIGTGEDFLDDAIFSVGFHLDHHLVTYGDGVGEAFIFLSKFTANTAIQHSVVFEADLVPASGGTHYSSFFQLFFHPLKCVNRIGYFQ